MATPAEKLAQSLDVLRRIQLKNIAIRSTNLSRTHRERLITNGFLKEVMRGWYIPTRPDQLAGESTAWYASYWAFCADYLNDRFGDDWCLSPEQSLSLHVGNRTVPPQLIVRSNKGSNNLTHLPQNTTILDIHSALPAPPGMEQKDGLNLLTLPVSLLACSPSYFRNHSTDVRAAMASISDAADILPGLLDGGHTVIAGRIAGGFRNIGRERIADNIVKAMKSAGFDCREEDPFEAATPILFGRADRSAHVNRIRLMWHEMRQPIINLFPSPMAVPHDIDHYLTRVQDNYITDAYHSLSIEGYKVSRELIERVKLGAWNPEAGDREQRDALAARGYWQSYQTVRSSLARVLNGANAGTIADDDHGDWYRELFSPSIAAGLLRPADLAGYRSEQVYIRHSMHVPPDSVAVRDMMPAFFDLLSDEKEPSVRVVLGHFIFVYIHPYTDGNGRIGRFLMNLMLASGGYPWTVVPVERRDEYLEALESASAKQDVIPFCKFLAGLVEKTMKGKPEAK